MFFGTGNNSILSQRNHVGMSHVTTHCARGTVSCQRQMNKRRGRRGHAMFKSVLNSRHVCAVFLQPSSDLAIDCEVRLAFLPTPSSTPTTYGHHVGLPALYLPFTADTCCVTSSALRPLVQTSARLSLPDTLVHRTTFLAGKLCTNKKLQSTCLSLPRGLDLVSHPRLGWRRCTRPCSTIVPGLCSQIECPLPRRSPSPRRTARTRTKMTQQAIASCSSR